MPRDATASKLEIVTQMPDKAMVIFAHPDDAEIGSGGVVAKWAAAGCEVTYVLCTNGAAGTADRALGPAALAKKRAAEQRAAADFMGVRHVVMLGYRAGGLDDRRPRQEERRRARRGLRLPVRRGVPAAARSAVAQRNTAA